MEFITLGRYHFFDLECRVVRRSDGVHGYVRVPLGHELYGRRASEVDLALYTPWRVSYSAGGAHGWFIGVSGLDSWEAAVDSCEALARQLAAFEASHLSSSPRAALRSGIWPRIRLDNA